MALESANTTYDVSLAEAIFLVLEVEDLAGGVSSQHSKGFSFGGDDMAEI